MIENIRKNMIAGMVLALVLGALAGGGWIAYAQQNLMADSVNTTQGQRVNAVTAVMPVVRQQAANSSSSVSAPQGTFKSNEDPRHEAQESPQQEALENSGQSPCGR